MTFCNRFIMCPYIHHISPIINPFTVVRNSMSWMFANIHEIVKIWTLKYIIFADINIPLLCLKLKLYVGGFLTFIYLLLNFWRQNVMLQQTVFGKIIMLSCVAENVTSITMKELSYIMCNWIIVKSNSTHWSIWLIGILVPDISSDHDETRRIVDYFVLKHFGNSQNLLVVLTMIGLL